MDNTRITVILGAGAMCEVTNLSTNYLTEKVIEVQQDNFDKVNTRFIKYPLIESLYNKLVQYYKEDEIVSFEDILHLIEMIYSYYSSTPSASKEHKSIFPLFTDIKIDLFDKIIEEDGEYIFVSIFLMLLSAEGNLIETVMNEVGNYENGLLDSKNKWFKKFFTKINKNNLDIFNLNYDTWLEQLFCGGFNDGYEVYDEEFNVFNPLKLANNENQTTINHLHGQVCFSKKHPLIKERLVWDSSCSMFKANNFDIIKKYKLNCFGGNSEKTQSGEAISKYPIISGLRKNDKLINSPFDAYYHNLYRSVLNNNRLLIIGYGFNDLYLNEILTQYCRIHKDDGKAVVITYIDKNDWRLTLQESSINLNEKNFYFELLRNEDIITKRYREVPGSIISENGNKIIYTRGFKNVAENNTDEVIEVLS